MRSTDLQRLEAGIRQAYKQGDTKTVDVLGAELRRIQKMPTPTQPPQKKAPPERSLFGAAVEAIPNIPSSAAEFATGLYNAVTNPIETAGSLLDIAAGGLKTGAKAALPKDVYNFINDLDRDPKSAQRAVRAAQQFGGQMKDRYGTYNALKNTLATDPVGFAADVSSLLSGGAGAVRTGGKVVSKAAPKVAANTERVANAMTRVADATNPVNALRPVGRAVVKAAERTPLKIANALAPKSAAYMEAAEGRAPELIAQLRAPSEIVPGSKPTAAQQASPLGLTKFSAMGEAAAKALPSQNLARAGDNEAARLASLRTVGGTAEDLAAAKTARTEAAGPFYREADKILVEADKKFTSLLGRPSMDRVLSRASELAAEKGVPFQIGKNRPEQNIPSKILNAEGQPMGTINIPGETAKYPGSSLHMMKMAFDDLIKNPERFGIGATEVRAIGKTREEFLNWAENKVPPYKTARATFAAKSKPINQMEVGQYLEGKLTAPLEGGTERAGVFATAVKNAPGTLKRATNNQVRFNNLTDVLTPEQVRIVNAIRDDLSRVQTTKTQAQKGTAAAPRISQLASQIGDAPAVLNRVVTIANTIFNRLQGQIDRKLAIEIATEMLDPKAAAAAIQKAATREGRARTTGRIAGGGARVAGKALGSTAAKVGAQTQNLKTQAENENAMRNIYGTSEFPDFDPDSGEPLVDIDYSEGYPVPIYGKVSRNKMRR
jgi:hypothetical protein